ncbi:MAG: hypothetical protein QOF73_3947, partial [Thermomicrobiales bacterium]|nr:hypothetical protein [Thermomicrobiales bacterium]
MHFLDAEETSRRWPCHRAGVVEVHLGRAWLTTTGGVGGGRLAWLSSRDDGGRSLIRKAAGIEFPGWDPTVSHLIAEVELAEEPAWGLRRDALGIHSLSSMGEGGPVRRCDIL